MSVMVITKDNFEAEVVNSPVPVLLDFWATWCGPCRMVSPIVDEIAEESDGSYKVGKINVDEQPELASAFRVMSRLGDDGYTMVYPLLGGSADGVYRYTREVYWTPTIGMDVDCSGVSDGVLFSVVREMDEAMEVYLEQWLAGEVWPARQTFGLSSGWTDIVLAPRLSGSRWQTWLEACRTEAWAKEEEYYEALSLD